MTTRTVNFDIKGYFAIPIDVEEADIDKAKERAGKVLARLMEAIDCDQNFIDGFNAGLAEDGLPGVTVRGAGFHIDDIQYPYVASVEDEDGNALEEDGDPV